MEQAQSQEEQILTAVVEALSQGTQPEELAQALVQQGIPKEAAVQFVQMGIKYIQEQSGAGQQTQQPVEPGQEFAQAFMGGRTRFLKKANHGGPHKNGFYGVTDDGTDDSSSASSDNSFTGNFYDEEVPFQTQVNILNDINTKTQQRVGPYATPSEENNPTFFTNEDSQDIVTRPLPDRVTMMTEQANTSGYDGSHYVPSTGEKANYQNVEPLRYTKTELSNPPEYIKQYIRDENEKKRLLDLSTLKDYEEEQKRKKAKADRVDWKLTPATRPLGSFLRGIGNIAQGTMEGVSDFKTAQYGGKFEPHMMIHPSTNKSIYVLTENDHNEYANKGYLPQDRYKWGGFKLDPAKKGTFKAQATRMGVDMDEAADRILSAPEGEYSPEMRKKANFYKNFAKELGGLHKAQFGDITDFDKKNALGNVPNAGGFDWSSSNFTLPPQQTTQTKTPGYSSAKASFNDPQFNNNPDGTEDYVDIADVVQFVPPPIVHNPEDDNVIIPGSEPQQGEPNPLAVPENAQSDSEAKRQLDAQFGAGNADAPNKKEGKAKFPPAHRILLGMAQMNNALEEWKERRKLRKKQNKIITYGNTVNDSDYYASNDAIFGGKDVNRGLGTDIFNSQHTVANMSKYGGLSKFVGGGPFNYKDGDEVMMTEDELRQYIQMGGQVEILDDFTKPKY